jgi:hypothetical protein
VADFLISMDNESYYINCIPQAGAARAYVTRSHRTLLVARDVVEFIVYYVQYRTMKKDATFILQTN